MKEMNSTFTKKNKIQDINISKNTFLPSNSK